MRKFQLTGDFGLIRHLRKYAEGDLRWNSLYFRGPADHQKLKAHNLLVFCQIAQGIDEPSQRCVVHDMLCNRMTVPRLCC